MSNFYLIQSGERVLKSASEAKQLLREGNTSLTLEVLGVHKPHDEKRPFFQKQNYW